VEHEDQIRFQWAEEHEGRTSDKVEIDPKSTDAAVALMARAMIAVVRAVKENDDER
jgi:hypothetical protein